MLLTELAAIRDALPRPDAMTLASALDEVAPWATYRTPIGSGEAEEIALRRGWKPVLRQILAADQAQFARARFERDGFLTLRMEADTISSTTGSSRYRHVDGERTAGRVILFVGRDASGLAAAAGAEQRAGKGDAELGAILGFPSCCIEAFVRVPQPRPTVALLRAALAQTSGPGDFRLNVCELRMFHYLSWIPCSFRCPRSVEYASRIETELRTEHPAYAAVVAGRLSATRLFLHPQVQLSMRGRTSGRTFVVDSVWPSVHDLPPDVRLDSEAREATARLLVAVRSAGVIRRSLLGALGIPGVARTSVHDALLIPFDRR